MSKLEEIQNKIKNIDETDLAYTITEATQDSWHTSQTMGPALKNIILNADTEKEINLIDNVIIAITNCSIEELIDYTQDSITDED